MGADNAKTDGDDDGESGADDDAGQAVIDPAGDPVLAGPPLQDAGVEDQTDGIDESGEEDGLGEENDSTVGEDDDRDDRTVIRPPLPVPFYL